MASILKNVKKIAKANIPVVVNPLNALTPITTTYKVTKAATDLTSKAVQALPIPETAKKVLDPVAVVKSKVPDLSLSKTSAGAAAAEAAKRQKAAEIEALHRQEAEKAAKQAAAAARQEGLKISSASAGSAATMAAINKAKADAEKARAAESDNVKNGGAVPGDKAAETAETVDPYTKQLIKDAGASASEGAAVNIILPEQQVKSDYTKYLLIGGAVVLAVWLFKKK